MGLSLLLLFAALLVSLISFLPKTASLVPLFRLWRPLPHVPSPAHTNDVKVVNTNIERGEVLTATGAAMASSCLWGAHMSASEASPAFDALASPRSVVSVDSHLAIPVWPSWAGGRVIPISLSGALQDPFLLLAHHDHWFDPRDPLREPFKMVGRTLGLPYVDVEGFSMHPHRGIDIWTYVLDGSDGFHHRDSLGDSDNFSGSTTRTYRGGTAQWMRTGSGVMHEEFWETKPDQRTNIELFQLWVNLPASHKFDPPAIRYLGKDASAESHQWLREDIVDRTDSNGKVIGTVRNLGATLDRVITSSPVAAGDTNTLPKDVVGDARQRPPVQILHATITDHGGQWTVEAPLDHSAVIYVRKGGARLRDIAGDSIVVKAQQTASFGHNGGTITIANAATTAKQQPLDILVLIGAPLRESVIQAGPIVMNSVAEVNDAYQQLQDGTFLDRAHVLQQRRQAARS